MGWITDAPDFDLKHGKKLLDQYLKVRHLLIGSWYPLLPYSREDSAWMASQYHRPDLQEGMILVFRHAESPYRTADLALRGLDADSEYVITYTSTNQEVIMKGADMMKNLPVTISEKHQSELILYRKR
jgi:alpha-galactosidase